MTGPLLKYEATTEMKPGSKIIITDIKYKVNNGKTRKSNSTLKFTLM